MIQSFKSQMEQAVFDGQNPKGFPANLISVTKRKLLQINGAKDVEDLRSPPGNRLHQLSGDRAGQWSISVNMQFRICFVWTASGPAEVEFIDYH